MLKISCKNRVPTPQARALQKALEELDVKVYMEVSDGHKCIDLTIPKAKINVEIDGIQHLTSPRQIIADLNRGYYSNKKGYGTMHIPNEMLRTHLKEISVALAEAAKKREQKLHVHLN